MISVNKLSVTYRDLKVGTLTLAPDIRIPRHRCLEIIEEVQPVCEELLKRI